MFVFGGGCGRGRCGEWGLGAGAHAHRRGIVESTVDLRRAARFGRDRWPPPPAGSSAAAAGADALLPLRVVRLTIYYVLSRGRSE